MIVRCVANVRLGAALHSTAHVAPVQCHKAATCSVMDEDGFIEVKRKQNRPAELPQVERRSASDQQARNGRQGNGGRMGNRRRNARPVENSSVKKPASQRQDTAASRLQRSGRSTPNADSAPASQRPAKARGGRTPSARGHAAKHCLDQKSSSHAQSDRPVPAGPRKPAWQRPDSVQPGASTVTTSVTEAQPRHGSHVQHAVEGSTGSAATAQSVSDAGATPLHAPGDTDAAAPPSERSAWAAAVTDHRDSRKPPSWAAAARMNAVEAGKGQAAGDAVSNSEKDKTRIPGQKKLQIRIHKSNVTPSKPSPSSSRSQTQQSNSMRPPRSSPHSSQAAISIGPPSHTVGVQPAAADLELPVSTSSREAPAVDYQPDQAAAPSTASAAAVPASPQPAAGEPPLQQGAAPEEAPAAEQTCNSAPADEVVQQLSAWRTEPTAAASDSPGEFGDELAVLAHSLTDGSTPPGREHAVGISNPHSLCFMIAPLQAMLATRPFQALMSRLPDLKGSLVVAKALPVLAGLAELADFIRSPSAAVRF